jgi:hydroxyacylglutathione hydrolase
MSKGLTSYLAVVISVAISIAGSAAQLKPTVARQENAATGKEYVSTRLAPGIWHIEDTVHETYRDSMYLVEGNEKAALIDTGMGSGDLAGYVKTLTKLPVIVLITHGHRDHTGQMNQFTTVYFPK